MPARPKLLVIGGGFAALETAFLLRMRHRDDVDIRLVSDRDTFVFRPNSIYVPFGADPDSLLVDLAKPLRRRHIAFERGSVAEVDPDARLVTLDDGERFAYDKLVIATGADTDAAEIPGLAEHGATIWTTESMLDVRHRFERIRVRAQPESVSGSSSSSRRTTSARGLCTRSSSCSRPGCGARRPSSRRSHLVDLRARLHPGLRAAPARARQRGVRRSRHRRPTSRRSRPRSAPRRFATPTAAAAASTT